MGQFGVVPFFVLGLGFGASYFFVWGLVHHILGIGWAPWVVVLASHLGLGGLCVPCWGWGCLVHLFYFRVGIRVAILF